MLTVQRRNVRDALEKSIALWKATGRQPLHDHYLISFLDSYRYALLCHICLHIYLRKRSENENALGIEIEYC